MTKRLGRPPRILHSPITGQEIVLVAVIVALWLVLGMTTKSFLSPGSIQPLLASVAPIALVGIGMTFVIITGGIDISVAAMLMVSAVVTSKLLVATGMPLIPASLISMLIGGALGCVNGLLISLGRVHPIIITFGTANLFQFLGLRIFGSQTVNGIPPTFDFFGRGEAGRTLGVPHSFLITFIVAVFAWWYLRHTAGGRHLFAIGGDTNAARLAGVMVQRRTVLTYVITGLLVGVAACFTISLGTSTLDQSVGSGSELAAIAAVVIGGTSIMGGRGSVVGTILGAILVQTVSSGVTQLGWPTQLANLFVGIFIIIAVGTDLVRQRARRKS
jgi:ribose transport system permease protein